MPKGVSSGEIEKSPSGGTGSRDHTREGLPVEVTAGLRREFQHKSLGGSDTGR